MSMDFKAYQAAVKADFRTFLERAFIELYGEGSFIPGMHIDIVSAALQRCLDGKCRRLIICLPPRYLKSFMSTIALSAFILGHRPNASVLGISYAQDLADELARQALTIMQADFYKKVFPTRLAKSKPAVDDFRTAAGGSRRATGVQGSITGFGADFIFIDDPIKPEAVESEDIRTKTNRSYGRTIHSRLNKKKTGVAILIAQRTHEDDLVGYLIRRGGWDVVSLPAIAEEDEEYLIESVTGTVKRIVRRAGEPLHPQREPLETLLETKKEIGAYDWQAQYQQRPAPPGGGEVKSEWFSRYDVAPTEFDMSVQSWDTANKPDAKSDKSVCTTWGKIGKRYYLLHVLRRQMEFPDLKRAIIAQKETYRPDVVLIENQASGIGLIQDLRAEDHFEVEGVSSSLKKIMRVRAQTGTLESGNVFIPRDAHWVTEFLHEVEMFPNGRYDDQVDSMTQALEYMKRPVPGWGVAEYYRRINEEEAKSSVEAMVELRAPHGVTQVQTQDGKLYSIPIGIVAVPISQYKPLLQAGFELMKPLPPSDDEDDTEEWG